jgi:uncharacterized membrane protein YuzA (DUF378 family)
MGKGLTIGCAGLLIAALFGGPAAAVATIWTILATGLAGAGCMWTATAMRREHHDAEEAHRQEVRELLSLVRERPVIEIVTLDPWAKGDFASRLDRERAEAATQVKAR